jgi:hypothetical protein
MMNLSSNKLVGNLSKKARNWFALIFALGTCQAFIPVTLLLTSSLLLTTEVAYAVESAPVTLVQAFGWDPASAAYKILIQSRNGNQYFVWYSNLIGAKVGSVITLTYEGTGSSMYFYKLINTGNGKESSVLRYLKAN